MSLQKTFAPLLLIVSCCFACQSHADIVFNEIEFTGSGTLELINNGATSEDISTWWFCNRISGAPFYDQVQDVTVSSSGSFNLAAGELVVLSFSDDNFLPDASGELGLYTTNSFASSAAIHDYIQWGIDGSGRDSVADGAGIWTEGDFIDVSTLAAGESVQLTVGTAPNGSGHVGDGPNDYFFADSTLGSVNSVPEPTSAVAIIGLMALVAIRRKHK